MNKFKLLSLIGAAALLVAAGSFTVQSTAAPDVSFDGLHLVEDSKLAIAYLKPEADFSIYSEFMMLDAYVAFKKDWQRKTRVAGRRVSNKDMERIKKEAAELLRNGMDETRAEAGLAPMEPGGK